MNKKYMSDQTLNAKRLKLNAQKGFTLIELLIVVAIIAILAAVVFVALDPLKRFQDSRDSSRWHDIAELSTAIKLHQVDNGGYYATSIRDLATSSVYMIGEGNSGCDDQNEYCATNVNGDSLCTELPEILSGGQIAALPQSPNGNASWSAIYTGYTIQKSITNSITIRACEKENSTEIFMTK